MAEESESALQLPPSTAAEGEGPTEVSPETATPDPPSSAAVSPGTEEPAGDTKKKIDVLLKAVGDTPIMKTKKWAVERTRTIQGLIDFIKKFLKLVASEQLREITAGRERGREGSRQAPAEQRARCVTRSQDPEIMT
ncbi:ubiquitin-like protein ATG12 isoform X1 [Mustela nigripes]|uniref:ubiquitin-like protein ATG12 isoform X1 n=1 Tax=Mustela nigripes TaxID=77151 RepID=UPI0028149ED3|nr:ubiquitin-like protein ATG12 isoform X1 [Mustela nigripes]